eukprot:7083167-Prymnesium_polylepis.2
MREVRSLEKRSIDSLVEQLFTQMEGIPTDLLSTVRDDLIVSRVTESASTLIAFAPSVLRLSQDHSHKAQQLQTKYGELLNVTVQASRYVDSDMEGPKLRFGQDFFINRSFKGWV